MQMQAPFLEERARKSPLRNPSAPIQASFRETCNFGEGVLPEIGWFSSTREEDTGEGVPSRSRGVADLALCLPPFAASKYERREAPSEGPLLMKTSRFLAGLPSFSATEVRRRVPLARASVRKRAERHVRLGGHVGRTRCSALR